MAGGLGERALLAPAGHAAIDEARVARQDNVRAEPQSFHHARAKAFDQGIGVSKQVQHLRDRFLVL